MTDQEIDKKRFEWLEMIANKNDEYKKAVALAEDAETRYAESETKREMRWANVDRAFAEYLKLRIDAELCDLYRGYSEWCDSLKSA